MVASKNVDFVDFLKKFEKDVLEIPPKYRVIVCSTVANHLNHMFEKHINLRTITVEKIDRILHEISKHTNNREVQNFILSKLIFELKYNSENHNSQIIGQKVINAHLFKIH
jgi:hypothetical protein